jgi:antitoxin component of MazEF toxin-antitoxin module
MRTTTVKVQRWSDGLAVRLPSSVVRDMRLTPGQSVQVTCRGGIITMKATPKREPTLRERVRVVEARVKDGARAMTSRMRAH